METTMKRKSCYASPKLENGKRCPNHNLNGAGQYCKCILTGKVPNPETCGKSYEWERVEVCPKTGNTCTLAKCKEEDCPVGT